MPPFLNLQILFLNNVLQNHTDDRILCNNIHISRKELIKDKTMKTAQLTQKELRMIVATKYMEQLRANSLQDLYLSAMKAGADRDAMFNACVMAENYYQTAKRLYVELKNRDVKHAVEDEMVETIRNLALASENVVPTL